MPRRRRRPARPERRPDVIAMPTVAPQRRLTAQPSSGLARFFRLDARGTDIGTEVRAGLTTFMVMSYIIVVNAAVLTTGAQIAGQSVSFPAVVTSTCLVAGLGALAVGLAANLP